MTNKEYPEYRIWLNMRDRCNNPNNNHWHRYGGRGIKVCARWDSFKLFLEDMGRRPSSKHSIDRENNNGGYNPGNCVWSTSDKQSRNTSRNTNLTYQGRTMALGDWADELGIDRTTLQCRIYAGWTVEDALTAKPPYHNRRHQNGTKPPSKKLITWKGRTASVPEWARILGLSHQTIHGRLYRGWSIAKALSVVPKY